MIYSQSGSPQLAALQGHSFPNYSHKSHFTKKELEELWIAVNGNYGNPHLMAAIALAESSGNSQEVNSIGACGLWQIHPYQNGCLDPITNAKQARQKLKEQGLKAWTTYTEGQYKKFLTGPTTKNASLESFLEGEGLAKEFGELPPNIPEVQKQLEKKAGNPLSPIEDLGNAFKGFVEVMKFLTSAEGWARILKVLGGAILIGIAVIELAKVGAGGETRIVPNTASTIAKNVTSE